MKNIFEKLKPEEFDLLKDAIHWITILIGGADGNLDPDEKIWAEKVTNIRAYNAEEEFHDYYAQVGEDFNKRLETMIIELPDDVDARASILSGRLSKLNPVLAKIDPKYGHVLYKEFLSFSKHVAKASGGFLSFFSISAEEKKWLKLPMIDPIEYTPAEEEKGKL